jgi:hypothetical protein
MCFGGSPAKQFHVVVVVVFVVVVVVVVVIIDVYLKFLLNYLLLRNL